MIERESLDFLKNLIEIISPSGSEEEAVNFWKKRTEKFAAKVEIDVQNNARAVLNEGGKPRLMLAAHIDEVGYMFKYIDKEGYIYFSAVGGIDTQLVPGQRVWIKTSRGNILGLVGKKPIHLLEEEERKKPAKIEQLWMDIGAKDGKEARAKVNIGDVAVPAVGFEVLNSDKVAGRGFDDKAGAFVVSEVLKSLRKEKLAVSFYGVATVQEEIGLRGARTSAYGISPDIGIALDVTFATDFPTMDKKKVGDIKIGSGPVIAKGPNITPKIFNALLNVAKKKKIPYQIEAIPHATGTDANVIQLTKSGVATGLVSIPLRYMHTPVELVSLKDLENTVKLLKEFILSIGKNFF